MHKALGRGLDALLQPSQSLAMSGGESIAKISLEKIHPNRYQPRSSFPQESLQELADSIRQHGLAQPLLVAHSHIPGDYELVAGERRLRAAKLAGLTEVPCVIREVNDRQRSELSLIENIQREDLNVLEEAQALRKLMDQFGLTQEDIAKTLGRSRSSVANKLRLLELPDDLQRLVREGQLSEGHARSLLAVEDPQEQRELSKKILEEKLTVRDIEKIAGNWQTAAKEGRVKIAQRKNPDIRRMEEDLRRVLGRKVEIRSKGHKGHIKLGFYSSEDFHRLVQHLKGKKDGKHHR